MATQVEPLKVYMLGVEYPTCLNDPSPAKLIPLAGDWRTEDAQSSRRNVRRAHRHVGLVLHYDPTTHIAVIFLGSSAPLQPQRYIPWEGTQRLPYQTTEILKAQGADFRNHPGFLNFTHAIRVLVLQPGAITSGTTPGLACITDILDRGVNPPNALDIRLCDTQVEMLKSLHASYWMGLRYSLEGTTEGGDDEGEDSDCGGGECVSRSEEGGGERGSEFREGGGVQGKVASNEDVRESVSEMSFKLGRALDWEDFRNSQLTMVEGDEEAVDIDSLPKCVIGPLTEQDLQRGFCAHESGVGFPWEKELNVRGLDLA